MHIEKRGSKYRVAVHVDNKRQSKTFHTKREALAWGNAQEQDGILARHTVHEALDEYIPIASKLKGSQAQLSRLKSLKAIPNIALESVTPSTIATWRDARLKEVQPSSVRVELVILGRVFKYCRDEWGWMRNNPLTSIAKPKASKPRKRGVTQDEIDTICRNLEKAKAGKQVSTMFLLAIETGMRLSEMLSLRWPDISEKTLVLRNTKNEDDRIVSLSPKARELIESRRIDPDKVFVLSAHVVSKTFARHTINGCHFHDSRSEAITRLSKKLDVMQLAKMIGHRDLKSLMIYYAESPESIADRL